MTASRTRMRVIRPFTTHVVNPIARRFASWLPGFGILEYRGRKSGRAYRTLPARRLVCIRAYLRLRRRVGEERRGGRRLHPPDARTGRSPHRAGGVRRPEPAAHAARRPNRVAVRPRHRILADADRLTAHSAQEAAGHGPVLTPTGSRPTIDMSSAVDRAECTLRRFRMPDIDEQRPSEDVCGGAGELAADVVTIRRAGADSVAARDVAIRQGEVRSIAARDVLTKPF
jgi:hypothetical protein